MRDKEYSSQGWEYAPAGPEFSRSGKERQAPPPESVPAGPEYSPVSASAATVPAAAPVPKRKRIRPAMFTTAAAAVVLFTAMLSGPVSPPSAEHYPSAEITAAQRAYLDAVLKAMETADLDGLEALAQDAILRELTLDVIAPYAAYMEETYGLEYAGNAYGEREGIEGGKYGVYYDGTNLCVEEALSWDRPTIQLSYSASGPQSSVLDDLDVDIYYYTRGVSPLQCRFSISNGGNSRYYGGYVNVSWYDLTDQAGFEGGRYSEKEGSYCIRRLRQNGTEKNGFYEVWLRGEFEPVLMTEEANRGMAGRSADLLVNGTATFYFEDSVMEERYGIFSDYGEVEVVDGASVRWDDSLEMVEVPAGADGILYAVEFASVDDPDFIMNGFYPFQEYGVSGAGEGYRQFIGNVLY